MGRRLKAGAATRLIIEDAWDIGHGLQIEGGNLNRLEVLIDILKLLVGAIRHLYIQWRNYDKSCWSERARMSIGMCYGWHSEVLPFCPGGMSRPGPSRLFWSWYNSASCLDLVGPIKRNIRKEGPISSVLRQRWAAPISQPNDTFNFVRY